MDGRVARGGHEARSHRDLLLPTLHAVQDRRLDQPRRAQLRLPPPDDPARRRLRRRLVLRAAVHGPAACGRRPRLRRHGLPARRCRGALRGPGADARARPATPGEGAPGTWLRSPCLGQCERAPAALFTVAGDPPIRFSTGPLDAARSSATSRTPGTADQTGLAAHLDTVAQPGAAGGPPPVHPPGRGAGLRLLGRVGRIDPTSLTDYLANGGYRALREAIDVGPDRVIEEVITAEVLGRGGAAFPAGQKWAAARASTGFPKYIVCNADEAEPGTFKDRAILEEDPFALVEAMTIASFAVGAELGFVYLRGEYPLAEARMQNAIDQARASGLLGPDVMGAGFAFDIEIRRGGGAYVCGEGTAIYESIEGKRGEPRNKAARSTTAGLFQKPTVLNNVETLVNIPGIVLEGGEIYASLGTHESNGHKLFSVSGHVARPGVYEAEFGITLRDLIELAGGVPGGRAIKAVNLGGAAGVFVGTGAPAHAAHLPARRRSWRRRWARARSSCSTRPPT